jgi:hypothetical protein
LLIDKTVEARGLALFTSPDGPLQALCGNSNVLVPQLLYHDLACNILVLSDLGPLSTLSQYLISEAANSNTLRQMGKSLGGFFGELHSAQTKSLVGEEYLEEFYNPMVEEVIFEGAVRPIEGYLDKYHISNGPELYRRVLEDFQRINTTEEQGFILGDLWTGGILVGPSTNDAIGVIDWEFSGLGRGVSSDMAQLLAHLHLHLLASPSGSGTRRSVDELIQSLGSSYRHRIQALGQVLIPSLKWTGSIPEVPVSTSVFAQTMRSTFLLHGREIINNAIERKWACKCCTLDSANDCLLTNAMVNRGAWYLNIAQANEEQFVRATNWKEICAESDWILGNLLLGERYRGH